MANIESLKFFLPELILIGLMFLAPLEASMLP